MPKSYFQSQFWMSKINRIFSKKNLSKHINLGDHYLLKTFFSKLNFWTTLLSKITSIFWQTVITRRNFFKIFPWWHVDSWPKSLLFRTHHFWNSTTELILIPPPPTPNFQVFLRPCRKKEIPQKMRIWFTFDFPYARNIPIIQMIIMTCWLIETKWWLRNCTPSLWTDLFWISSKNWLKDWKAFYAHT